VPQFERLQIDFEILTKSDGFLRSGRARSHSNTP
jgi:hypothetical protein